MFPYILLLLSVSFGPSSAISTDTILPGESLSGNQTLVSQGGTFEMGFFSPGNTGNYHFGIRYKGLPQKTMVWVAHRNCPVSNPISSELKLLWDGNLVLLASSKHQIWLTGLTSPMPNSTSGVPLDNGNFILKKTSDASTVAWQSFDHPTVTWLPGAKFVFHALTSKRTVLVAWRDLDDPAPGIFSAIPAAEGRAQLVFNRLEAYWHSVEWTGEGYWLQPSQMVENVIDFTFVSNENETYVTYSSVAPFNLSRVLLEPTGLLKQSAWAKHIQEWKVLWTQPKRKCEIYPFCVASSSCNQSGAPLCDCAHGYSDDLKLEDHLGRCNMWKCRGDRKNTFFLMPNTALPENSCGFMVENIEACRLLCLSNCSCSAYAFTADCLIWTDDKFVVQKSANDAGSKDFYFRIEALDSKDESEKKGKPSSGSITAVVVVSVAFLMVRMKRSAHAADNHLMHFEHSVLKNATKNFSEKIGEGGFSSVFRGALPDSTPIAVKKLANQNQSNKQFLVEVRTIGTIQHINVVCLQGFCAEKLKWFIVCEYLANGFLAAHLFQKGSKTLDWKTRYSITIGIARGLQYLHERGRDRIIHCNVKPENILLDSEFMPKIADFGLAKLVGQDVSHVITPMRGTREYLAPEWISGEAVTSKLKSQRFQPRETAL